MIDQLIFSNIVSPCLLVIAVVWIYQFSFLMCLEPNDFPGPYDKLIWSFVFVFVFPAAPFAFMLWKKATKDQQVPESKSLPRIGGNLD